MSGVNAHGLFTTPPELTLPEAPPVPWRATRHWMAPMQHHLLPVVAPDRRDGSCRCVHPPNSAQRSCNWFFHDNEKGLEVVEQGSVEQLSHASAKCFQLCNALHS